MRLHDKKLFTDKEMLLQMLNLRVEGYSVSALSTLYNCDKKAIRYQCKKYNVHSDDEIYSVERITFQTIPRVSGYWKEVNGELVNTGKSYKEYLQDQGAKYSPKY